MNRHDLSDEKQAQTVTLAVGIFIADPIMRSPIEAFDLLVRSAGSVVGYDDSVKAVPRYYANPDRTTLFVIVDTVLNQITDRPPDQLPVDCVIMLFVPWTILPLRLCFQWALDYAEIMIPCYAGFMIFSGLFTTISYVLFKVRNSWMTVCLAITAFYAVAGAVFLGMILNKN